MKTLEQKMESAKKLAILNAIFNGHNDADNLKLYMKTGDFKQSIQFYLEK